jgi:molybdate-binding protein/DNA-binding transcriptional regulator YhcF (GntR family)
MLWTELAARLAREIADGRRPEGEALPGVRVVARDEGCSPATAARAYTALRDYGVLHGTPRSAFVVAPHGAARAAAWEERAAAALGTRADAAARYTSADAGALTAEPGAVRAGADAGPWAAEPGALRVAGSDDPALDLLLRHSGGAARLAPGARGSVPGLEQLARGVADAAAVHLLDLVSGRWNEGFARSALAGQPVVLVHLWRREQGLVVSRGNPKHIRAVADLAAHRIAWRPPGAGSRLLLERLMLQEGIAPRPEHGVRAESHLAVAAAVAAGAADAGLAVRAVADSLGLDWIPVTTEWFELAMADGSRSAVDPLLDVLASTSVHARLAALPGYDLAMTGETRKAG